MLRGPRKQEGGGALSRLVASEAPFPCLYVDKATNLRRRFRQHLLPSTAGRAHQALSGSFKTKPRTSSCQFAVELNISSQPNRICRRLLPIAWAFPGAMSSRRMLSPSDFLLRTGLLGISARGSTLTRNVDRLTASNHSPDQQGGRSVHTSDLDICPAAPIAVVCVRPTISYLHHSVINIVQYL